MNCQKYSKPNNDTSFGYIIFQEAGSIPQVPRDQKQVGNINLIKKYPKNIFNRKKRTCDKSTVWQNYHVQAENAKKNRV